VSDLAAFLAACVSSPALLTSACALVVVPLAAWLIVRALAPPLARMGDDPAWQAPLAAAAAAAPGALFVTLGIVTLRDGWSSSCLQFASGRVLYAAIAALTALGLARATRLCLRRSGEVAHLVRRSAAPCPRVRAAGESAGVRVREISAAGPVVLLAGTFRPVVLVSVAARERVSDAELRAALLHEAAHARRGDPLCAALVTFVADLVPLPVGNLIALYRRAREFAADAHAACVADPCDIASALLALARAGKRDAPVAAFAEAGTVRERLGVLLAPAAVRPSPVRRALLAAGVAATYVAGAAPAVAALVWGFSCAMAAMP
jgi:Zn-dependent protease with chaperone function